MRIVDIKRGQKLVRATCREEDLMVEVAFPTVLPGAPQLGRGDRLCVHGVAGCFAVFCETDSRARGVAADAEAEGVETEARAGAETETDAEAGESPDVAVAGSEPASVEVFLFEAARIIDLSSTRSLENVSPAESTFKLRRSTSSKSAGPSSIVEGKAQMKKGGASSRGSVLQASLNDQQNSKTIVELTSENLRMLGKPGAENAPRELMPPAADAAYANRVPDAWQSNVKRYLRSSAADRNVRGTRLSKHMDQLRKHFAEEADVRN